MPVRISFGPFEFDSGRRALLRGEGVVPLAPKPFGLLQLLLERRPAAVDKSELLDLLWDGALVSETALTTVVNELRGALGESAREPRFVRTVHRFGYAFEGEARILETDEPGLAGTLLGRDLRIAVLEGETLIGRSSKLAGGIPDLSVSRRHARILAAGENVRIEDLGSRNGTFVRGQAATALTEIHDGDEIQIGLVALRFVAQKVDSRLDTRSASSLAAGTGSQAASSPDRDHPHPK